LAQIGQFEEAEKFALMAIELSPTKQLIRTPLINIYTRTDQSEKALALAKETYELDESKGDMWIMYAKVAARFDAELFNQLIDKAIEEGNESWVESLLKENITNNPDSLQNIISLSAFYVRVGNTTSSLEVLNDAIELFPENESQIGSLKKQIESGIDPTGTKY
jgi:tetratricopeptide (TPR) repeat protein